MSAFFKEESKLTPFFTWLVILLGIVSISTIAIQESSFDLQKTNAEGAIDFTYLWPVLIFTAVTALLLSIKLKLEIKEGKLRYSCFPFVPKFREISPESILEWNIKKVNPIFYAGGWGVRKRFFQKKTAYIMKGNVGLELKLKNGKTLFFSISNVDSLNREMNILMKKD